MSLLTTFYHSRPDKRITRLPLSPHSEVPTLRKRFAQLLEILSHARPEDCYQSLWSYSTNFRTALDAILIINGLSSQNLTLGEIVSLCIGTQQSPPLLAQYNLITESLRPVSIDPELNGLPLSTPKNPSRKTFAQVFPFFSVSGDLVYPSGVSALHHSEFEATYLALSQEAQDLQQGWEYLHPAVMLIYSADLHILAQRLVSLFGIDPATLNIHQLCELSLAWEDQPGLLPQLAGLVEFDEPPPLGNDDSSPIPENCSPLHFLLGNISQSGSHDWDTLLSFSLEELRSFHQGLTWCPEKHAAQERAKDRDSVFKKWFGPDSNHSPPPMVQHFHQQNGKKGIGL